MSKNVIRLAEKLKNELGIVVDPESYFTNRSKTSLQAGDFTWMFLTKAGVVVGGYEPMRKFVSSKKFLEAEKSCCGEIEVYAVPIEETKLPIN